MKKFIHLFAKRKKSQENFYNLQNASLSGNINTHFNESNIFKYFPFDTDGYGNNEFTYEILLNSRVEDISNSQKCLAQCLSNSHLSTPTGNELLDVQQKNKFLLSRNNLGSGSATINNEKEERKGQVKKNIYLINISNSKYFHVGSQKTVNVNKKPFMRKTVQSFQVRHLFNNYSSLLKLDVRNLLDCEERVAEKYILLISKHIDDQWRKFLKKLGLEDTTLETLELRNNNNKILSVYDALHKYITLFPNTSLGFVIYVLIEFHQVVVIEKLAQELKI